MNKTSKIMMVICLILFAIAIFIENYCTNRQSEVLTPISKCDSFDIIVSHYTEDHGAMIFNNTHSTNVSEFKNTSTEVRKLLYIDYPFKLKKKAGSDTIFVIKGDTLLNLTFRKDTQDSSIYDSSFRELFEAWRGEREKVSN